MSRVVAARAPGCVIPSDGESFRVPYIEGVETSRDPCAVVMDGLASVVEQFVDAWGRRSRGSGQDSGDRDALVAGAIRELVQRTQNMDPDGKGVSEKTIRSVMRRAYETTDLRTADALVTAARRPFALADGSIQIVQNERAAADVRTTCCSGSEWKPAPTLEDYRDSLTGAA